MPKTPLVHPNSAQARACCETCTERGAGVLLRTRVTPNLAVERARLCAKCASANGWKPAFA